MIFQKFPRFSEFYLQIDFVPLIQRADQMIPIEQVVALRDYDSEQNLSLPLKEN